MAAVWDLAAFFAASSHDGRTKALYAIGVSVKCKDVVRQTVMHYAARRGDDAAVSWLLREGAPVDAKDAERRTPLLCVPLCGDDKRAITTIKLLVEAGADTSVTGPFQRTVLHDAASHAMLETVTYLVVVAGVSVHATDINGETALLLGVTNVDQEGDCIAVATALCTGGADLEARAWQHQTAVHLVCGSGKVRLLRWLLGMGANPNAADNRGNRPLHRVLRWKSADVAVAMCDALLDAGADLNAPGHDGYTPLHVVSAHRSDLLDWLLTKRPDVARTTAAGNTALHAAVRANAPLHMLRALVTQGVNINAPGLRGFTALHFACSKAEAATVEWLLAQGADVRATATNGDTPLHVASVYNRQSATAAVAIMRQLIEAGADIDARNNDGRTPLHAGATALAAEGVTVLLEAGASVHHIDAMGEAVLHGVVRRHPIHRWDGVLPMVRLLVHRGPDVAVTNNGGDHAGHIAARNRHYQELLLLVAAGCPLAAASGTDALTVVDRLMMHRQLYYAVAAVATAVATGHLPAAEVHTVSAQGQPLWATAARHARRIAAWASGTPYTGMKEFLHMLPTGLQEHGEARLELLATCMTTSRGAALWTLACVQRWVRPHSSYATMAMPTGLDRVGRLCWLLTARRVARMRRGEPPVGSPPAATVSPPPAGQVVSPADGVGSGGEGDEHVSGRPKRQRASPADDLLEEQLVDPDSQERLDAGAGAGVPFEALLGDIQGGASSPPALHSTSPLLSDCACALTRVPACRDDRGWFELVEPIGRDVLAFL